MFRFASAARAGARAGARRTYATTQKPVARKSDLPWAVCSLFSRRLGPARLVALADELAHLAGRFPRRLRPYHLVGTATELAVLLLLS